MFEKVNPEHPDKVADRIAGAIVDYCYSIAKNPKVAVEVLIGHGECTIICESSHSIPFAVVDSICKRICTAPLNKVYYHCVLQDEHLAKNQEWDIRCGDNGIFKGMPTTDEQRELTRIAKEIFFKYPTDGKYILDDETNQCIVCQSYMGARTSIPQNAQNLKYKYTINPLGAWTGGTDVDSGATNRKLGSDMGDSITGGGLHGKDLSKADVSVNIYAWLKAQVTNRPVEIFCAIGDTVVDGKPYSEIVSIAKTYIDSIGGFEKFAEWGLIR